MVATKIYELFIPTEAYTMSLHPRTPKIIKITKDTLKNYQNLHHNKGNYGCVDILQSRGAIGVDCTDYKGTYGTPPEGIIWKLPPKGYIKLVEMVASDRKVWSKGPITMCTIEGNYIQI